MSNVLQQLGIVDWRLRQTPSKPMIIGGPFHGRADDLLTAMLKAIGLSRNDVHIATAETELKEIENYHPPLVLVFGETNHFTLQHNQLQHVGLQQIPLITTYHPDHLLQHPADKKKAWVDLQLAQKTLST
jgi:uracil-DNA glycosylase